jgi:microbial collagenase
VWFIADVADPDGTIIQVRWDFGDGETSGAWSPEHVYGREGTYTVTLVAVDDRGGVVQARIVVSVMAPVAPPPGGSGGCGCG